LVGVCTEKINKQIPPNKKNNPNKLKTMINEESALLTQCLESNREKKELTTIPSSSPAPPKASMCH
jgi:hypothetical protein